MGAPVREHILVVDDEPQIVIALEDLLGSEFTVHTATSPQGALSMMKARKDIAVVLTDQRMPQMAGDELVARINGSFEAQRIMVTGYADLSAVVRAVNDGRIFAYVTKPWNEDDLRLKVTKAAEQLACVSLTESRRPLVFSSICISGTASFHNLEISISCFSF
jgi:response regulator RpfG family c-di-GMP phosphodiesterase